MGEKIPWYLKKRSIIMGFLLVGPFILPLVWINPNMSKTRKLAWTVVLSILSYFLVIWTMDSIKKLEEYYQQMKTLM